MKGYAAASTAPAKRRWKYFAIAVLALVFFSLLVPLGFLLGRFPSGYLTEERPSMESRFGSGNAVDANQEKKDWESDRAKTKDVMNKLSQEVSENNPEKVTVGKESNEKSITNGANVTSEPKAAIHSSIPEDNISTSNSKGPPTAQMVAQEVPSSTAMDDARTGINRQSKGLTTDENGRSCQLEFGSYCLWSTEHKEELKDSMVKRLKDQLFVARAYYPSVAKLKGKDKLTQELKTHIQEHERMLSEAISDADLPPFIEEKIQKMDQVITRAKSCTVDCNNVDKKLRQILDLTEDEAHFHRKQSAFLYHLGAQTMPKSLHCLSMRLTVEYFKSTLVDIEQTHAHKLDSPSFRHYVIFSRNILAVSVAINSTVMNSEETGNIVFHLLTDRQNFFAMKFWFLRNSYKNAAIDVLNIEDFDPNSSYALGLPLLSPSEEFRVSLHNVNQPPPMQMRTEYISVFGHSHFFLPEILKKLNKVVVLDDDVVVQRDLSFLWNIDLGGKVNGAVEFCGLRMGELKNYLGGISHNGNACAWVSGLNIVDLEKWREHNVTRIYQQLLHKLYNGNEASWRAATLPISLLAFQDQIYALDDSLLLPGLGHDYGVSMDTIANVAALHYNGNMKPWLDLGIPKYKKHWKQFLTQQEIFMDQCNVNP